jgi:hypothetical protein
MSPFIVAARLMTIAVCGGAAVVGAAAHRAAADPDVLMGMLPQGFSSSNCKEVTPKGHAVEKVTCDQSSDPGGPSAAAFARYANADDLTSAFQNADGVAVASSCPGNIQSPGPWNFTSSGQTAGQVECGTAKDDNTPVVLWTDNAKLRVAAVSGSDITSLYQWWTKKSG